MRQKHPKKQFSTKFTDEAIWTIDELSEQWDCTKTEAIERALALARAGVAGDSPLGVPMRDVQVDTSQGLNLEQTKAAVPLVDPANLRAPVREHWREQQKREAAENLTKRANEDKLARALGRDDIEYDHEY